MGQRLTIDRHHNERGTIVVLTMADGENRWNTTFTRAFDAALDEVEATDGPAVLVTTSADEKFFSNGLDLEWVTGTREGSSSDDDGGDRAAFGPEAMALFARLLTFPLPTVCAVNGHCFGAGLMIALCHDIRLMREDRGYLCANELELGFAIPEPELALFEHKMPRHAFHQTVVLARRWTGPDALAAGIVQEVAPLPELMGRGGGQCRESPSGRREPGDHRLDEGASLRHRRRPEPAPRPRSPVATPGRLCVGSGPHPGRPTILSARPVEHRRRRPVVATRNRCRYSSTPAMTSSAIRSVS